MNKRFVALLCAVMTGAGAMAVTNIKAVDWGNLPPDGTADIAIPPEVIDLASPVANVTFKGTVHGTRPGIFQVDIKHDYDAAFHRQYVLCVQLEEGIGNGLYAYKALRGYAGFLAQKIKDIVANPDPDHVKSAALALTMWELDYDGYDPITMSVNTANLSLSNGLVEYVQTGESNALYAAILGQANAYIAQLKALTPDEAAKYDYRYYENPFGQDENQKGLQDYVDGDVPAPLAVIPFLAGAALALRRRGKRR